MIDPETIGRDLRKAGKTVAELCREAEVARSTFDRWVRGETEPTLRTIRKIEAALGRLDSASTGLERSARRGAA